MSINGVNNPLLSSLGPISRPTEQRTNDPRTNGGVDRNVAGNAAANQAIANATRTSLKPAQPIAGPNATQQAVPAEAPAGTDPALWSVLTSEERAFFAKSAALGPLTYGRIKAATQAAPPAPRGVRLDVRA